MTLTQWDTGLNDTLARALALAFTALSCTVEPIRLYLGYDGNLREKVPTLIGFFLLTGFFQLPLALFLVLTQQYAVLPLDRAIHIPLLLFLVAQLITAYRALNRLVTAQTSSIYLAKDQRRQL